jgi:putative membrane protein
MRKALVLGTIALAMSIAPAFARGQQPGGQSGQSGTRPPTSAPTSGGEHPATHDTTATKASVDQAFVLEAAKGGMAEVELGKLAAGKGSSERVKKFGQRMADDHAKANDEIKSLAQSKNITLPATPDAKEMALHDRLSKLSGAEFDKAYMKAMVADHKKDVNAFRNESQSGKDPEVKAWAAKTLPTLEEHLKMAEGINSSAVATSGTKTSDRSGTTSDNPGRPGGTTGTTGAPDSAPRR